MSDHNRLAMTEDTHSKTPDWVRWALVLPAALGAAMVVNFAGRLLVSIGSLAGLSETTQYFVRQITLSVVQPVVFMIAGAKVAPRHELRAAYVLTVFYAIVVAAVLIPPLASDVTAVGSWVFGGASILGIVAAVVVAHRHCPSEETGPTAPNAGSPAACARGH
jgi:cell division protein FtsW (lipid II flippase)